MARLFADLPAGARGHRGARRAARVHAGQSRLQVSRLSGAARRDADLVPAPASRRWARAIATGRITTAPVPRSSASSISSRSSTSPATSSSSGTSSISAGSSASSCRGAGRRPTAPSATRSASRRSIRSAWSCSSSDFSPRSAASGPTSISICRAAIGASASSSTSTSATARAGAAMTANVITYRGRSAAREVGKVLSIDEAEIDRLARLMSQFEFVDPDETIARHLSDAGLDPDGRPLPAVRAALARDPGSAAASGPALRRHGRLPGPAR